jgi:hypothetical protein
MVRRTRKPHMETLKKQKAPKPSTESLPAESKLELEKSEKRIY